MLCPDPSRIYPISDSSSMVYLRPLLDMNPTISDRFEIGEFTYYSDFNNPLGFFKDNVLYDFGYQKRKLILGRYCAIAHGCRFLMPDANHAISGPTTYPFPGAWSARVQISDVPLPPRRDTVVGHDVWLGYKATVLPGVTIGTGAVIGALSVVSKDVPPYAIAVGNPAKVVRLRYSPEDIRRLEAIAWWDWPASTVLEAMPILIGGDLDRLECFALAQGVLKHA